MGIDGVSYRYGYLWDSGTKILLMGRNIAIWGLIVLNNAYAVIIPLWCMVYLSTSPMVYSKCVSRFLVDVLNLAGITVSMVLGYVLPTTMGFITF